MCTFFGKLRAVMHECVKSSLFSLTHFSLYLHFFAKLPFLKLPFKCEQYCVWMILIMLISQLIAPVRILCIYAYVFVITYLCICRGALHFTLPHNILFLSYRHANIPMQFAFTIYLPSLFHISTTVLLKKCSLISFLNFLMPSFLSHDFPVISSV